MGWVCGGYEDGVGIWGWGGYVRMGGVCVYGVGGYEDGVGMWWVGMRWVCGDGVGGYVGMGMWGWGGWVCRDGYVVGIFIVKTNNS